jgi:hypothetical protein
VVAEDPSKLINTRRFADRNYLKPAAPPYKFICYDFSAALRYAIHFSDGVSMECSSSAAALRMIAFRHRVAPADLVTDKTEERILVWIYPSEDTIAEVIISA